jgi:hypothetical protein
LQNLAHCFSVRIELVFERNTSWTSGLEMWQKSDFVPNRPTQLMEKTHASLDRKPPLLEGGESSTFFHCEN